MINETRKKATWQELADRVDELQEKLDNSISKDELIEDINFAINATDSTDDYSIGLCNGMIYVKALLTDENPDYKKCQNNEEEKTYEFGLVVGTKREREYWLNKIRTMIEAIEELLPKLTSGDVRNRLSAKKQILEELLKEE